MDGRGSVRRNACRVCKGTARAAAGALDWRAQRDVKGVKDAGSAGQPERRGKKSFRSTSRPRIRAVPDPAVRRLELAA